jgi:peptide deformylase
MNLIRYPDPQLKTVSVECTEADLEFINSQLPEMVKVMDSFKGVGLAAIQVGIAKRFCIIKDKMGNNNVLINPELLSGDNLRPIREGCLSLPLFHENIERFENIVIKFRDKNFVERTAEMSGEEAQCLQHELNHLNGLLILDTVSLTLQQMWLKKAKKKGIL